MNEVAVVQAVYDVLNPAKATLVTDLSQGGVARTIKSLTRTVLAVPSAYYAIGIDCTGAREYNKPAKNVNSATGGIIVAEYSMTVRIADAAYPDLNTDPKEAEPYLTAHTNFRKLVDRIEKLIRETKFWPSQASSPRFCLMVDPRIGVEVKKENATLIYEGTSTIVLAAMLSFTLVDPNSKPGLLY